MATVGYLDRDQSSSRHSLAQLRTAAPAARNGSRPSWGRWGLEAGREPVRSVDLPGSAVMDTPPSTSAIMQRGAPTRMVKDR
jgi:hypothetical protein